MRGTQDFSGRGTLHTGAQQGRRRDEKMACVCAEGREGVRSRGRGKHVIPWSHLDTYLARDEPDLWIKKFCKFKRTWQGDMLKGVPVGSA